MVPNGELHIAAVDYSHTHHPYFCIVKHRSPMILIMTMTKKMFAHAFNHPR